MGRTGRLRAHEWAEVEPDIMSAAKGIGGGFPLGAVLAKEHVAAVLKPGTHGTTFGGNPLACAAGNAVLDVILSHGFLPRVDRVARHLWRQLQDLAARHPEVIEEVRGPACCRPSSCARALPTPPRRRQRQRKASLTVAAGQNRAAPGATADHHRRTGG